MDNSQCGILRLPLELRYQLYGMVFDTQPEPSLLRVNKLLHEDCMHYLREQQRTFTFNISGTEARFDDFSQWCFKVKRYTPRLDMIKDLILNIYPPDQNKRHEMWHIWGHVRTFCKKINTYRCIPKLTVNFIETGRYQWATGGIAHATMGLTYKADEIGLYDVEQILITLSRFVSNVEKPRLVLPRSYISTQPNQTRIREWIDITELLMKGPSVHNGAIHDMFRLLEDRMEAAIPNIRSISGQRSKALFVQLFGRHALLDRANLEEFKREWPHWDSLDDFDRPRCRPACHRYFCSCNGSLVEVSMADPSWWGNIESVGDLERVVQRVQRWQEETLSWHRDVACRSRPTGRYVVGTTFE